MSHKERPILFSGPMVNAIRDRRKSQTRRIIKFPKWLAGCDGEQPAEIPYQGDGYTDMRPITRQDVEAHCTCPYGEPGDRLWVRESWYVGSKHDARKPRDLPPKKMTVMFGAGGSIANQANGKWEEDPDYPPSYAKREDWYGKLRPSIFLPRWASRITLEVTGVRVERLQDISEADARAEGVEPASVKGCGVDGWWCHGTCGRHGKCMYRSTCKVSYERLWESINGPGSWDRNDWVWVVSFKQIKE